MAFDGIVTYTIVSELNKNIVGGKIDKVFQPSKHEIILGIYSNKNNYALYISTNPTNSRIHLTTYSKQNPSSAPNFCMLLRKHLLSSRIVSIKSIDLDRLVEIEVEGYNELNDLIRKKLIIEIMGKHSNIVLVNSNNIIIDSLKHLDSSVNSFREVLPAREYVYPQNEKHHLYMKKNYSNIDEIISKISNANFEFRLNNNNSDFGINITNSVQDNLYANFFIDDFYNKKEQSDEFINYKNILLKVILENLKKFSKRLENINTKLKESKNYEIYKIYGELIIANIYKLEEFSDCITVENYYDENKLVEIALDKSISLSRNAKKYFNKYNKLKNTLEIVNVQRQETENELNYLESLVYSLDAAKTIDDLIDINNEISENVLKKVSSISSQNKKSKQKKTENLPIKTEINGFTVFVGKNNKQNDYLTFKLSKSDDIWFHTSNIHGSHVVLKTDGKLPTSDTLLRCAILAAKHSKAKNSSSIPVDYTTVKNVKKPNGSKPGMVTYKNQKTLFVNV